MNPIPTKVLESAGQRANKGRTKRLRRPVEMMVKRLAWGAAVSACHFISMVSTAIIDWNIKI